MQKLAILLLLACAACTTRADGPASQQATAPAAAAPASSGTLGQIQALIGKAECSSDSQCQVLPIGAKACGGPAGFLAWSTAKTNAAELQALAERYKAEQQASNDSSGRISNCRVLTPPAAACRANTCQLGEAQLVR
jgi:hypothetical protein